ncbi:MAG TPA: hypothetical protein VK501_14425 [Baekduia sp.]|uniref:hypothetical protein n=1 Tax=Baekduia sp. TaxID=2600305 RepID=UPI002C74DC35|nr:hypothetical protein [Baekduia sp.]HMJ35103.1 hypothetical protein [Baekduia sp.]
MSSDARARTATALVVLASVLLLAATLAGYARRALLDGDQFASRATATLQDPAVRTVVAERVTDRLVQGDRGADLLAVRPLIASAVSGVVGGGAFGSLFHRAALDVHRAVFDQDRDTVVLTVADVGTVAGAALRQVRPALAEQVEREDRVTLARQDVGAVTADLARLGERVRSLAWILAVLTVVAAAAALIVSVDRRRTAGRLGVGAMVVGVAIVVGWAAGRAVVLAAVADDPDARGAAGAAWGAFLGDLRTVGWLLAGCGAVVAAAAASLIGPIAVEGPLRSAWRTATVAPQAPGLRLLRAAALVAGGLVVILAPLTALSIAATLAGVYLVYKGVESVLRTVARPAAAETDAATTPVAGPRRGRRVAASALAVAVVAATVAAFLAGGGADEPRAAVLGSACNGHAALCARPLDEVVLPATHNAMSVPLPGWFAALQERPIAGQLADGIRGLLLDTHYAERLANGRTRTVFESAEDERLAIAQDGIGPESLAAAQRLRERLGFRGSGPRSIYLCHTFCELGATKLPSVLDDLHDFLVTHPTEVVVVINQDYVTPADIVDAVDAAGLTRYAFTPPSGGRWPTLRQMIDDDRRLVFLAENEAGGAPWYQPVYARLTQETPFSFEDAAQLTSAADRAASCRDNRGPATAPLFLINNWITTDPLPRPDNAQKVNAYRPLLARARECRRLRHRTPTLLAVDFYRRGDLFRVVDALNGV